MPTLPLDLRGTAFQRTVWTALRDIPLGRTETYSEVAARIGHPGAARAVARACAANPVALLVPCHRVVPKAREQGVPKAREQGVPKAREQGVPKARGSRALPDLNDTGGWRWGAARKRELLAREAAR
jgi:O-6-methylguanine DNA methyltransferase